MKSFLNKVDSRGPSLILRVISKTSNEGHLNLIQNSGTSGFCLRRLEESLRLCLNLNVIFRFREITVVLSTDQED